MSYENALREREELFNRILNRYESKAKEDTRYLKTCAKLKKHKNDFMNGVPYIQIIQGKSQ